MNLEKTQTLRAVRDDDNCIGISSMAKKLTFKTVCAVSDVGGCCNPLTSGGGGGMVRMSVARPSVRGAQLTQLMQASSTSDAADSATLECMASRCGMT